MKKAKKTNEEKKPVNKKIIIDLNAETIVDCDVTIGVTDTLQLLATLGDMQKRFQEHLVNMMMLTHIEYGRKCATMKANEEKLSIEEAQKILEELWAEPK